MLAEFAEYLEYEGLKVAREPQDGFERLTVRTP